MELGNLLTQVGNLQANFTQTVYDNHHKAIQYSYGKMAMQRPDKFRWDVLKPIPQLIIANTTRLWIYDPDLEQVTIRSLKQAVGEAPTLLLSYNNDRLEQEYDVKGIRKKFSKLTWFMLTPKNPNNMFANVELGFANGVINQMQLKDHLGHTTLIQFERVQVNNPISTKLFTVKFPAGVDIIDETRRR